MSNSALVDRILDKAGMKGTGTWTGMSASLAYFEALRRERSPACLIQAQRDYFGAHTYKRIDRPSPSFLFGRIILAKITDLSVFQASWLL